MIDHPITTANIMARLKAALPIPTRLTLKLLTSLRNKNAVSIVPASAVITQLYYMGDEGGHR